MGVEVRKSYFQQQYDNLFAGHNSSALALRALWFREKPRKRCIPRPRLSPRCLWYLAAAPTTPRGAKPDVSPEHRCSEKKKKLRYLPATEMDSYPTSDVTRDLIPRAVVSNASQIRKKNTAPEYRAPFKCLKRTVLLLQIPASS